MSPLSRSDIPVVNPRQVEPFSLPAGGSQEVSLRLRLTEVSAPVKVAASVTSKTQVGDPTDKLVC